jgi:ketosteroid isomerase-like protein
LEPFFDCVADDVRWTVVGSHPLAGTFTSKKEFIEKRFEKLKGRLQQPPTCSVTRITVEDDVAVVEFQGGATTVTGRPYNNWYCWVLTVANGRITEMTNYLDSQLVVELFADT